MSEQWRANEAEMQRLRNLPVGEIDPAKREAEIDAEQDEIEYELGRDYLHRQAGQIPLPDRDDHDLA